AFVARDQRGMALLAEDADYVFDDTGEADYFTRFRQLGRYIPEGSKPGAAAAAVYVTHRVLPLDHQHFGRLMRESLRSTEAFRTPASRFASRLTARLHCSLPFTPDSNLVCLAFNPVGNTDIATANAFTRALYARLRCEPDRPQQSREFFGSMTTLDPERLGSEDTHALLCALDLDPGTLDGDDASADRLVVLRHTLMNPFLLDAVNGI